MWGMETCRCGREHTDRSIHLKKEFERQEGSLDEDVKQFFKLFGLDEDVKQFFKLFEESTFEGSRAAARKMI
jgi:hypothetical protein